MAPEILVLAAGLSATAMARLEENFNCHHLWAVPQEEREDFINQVGAKIRGVLTVGPIGIDMALVDLLPQLQIVVVNSVGLDQIDLVGLRQRRIRVTNTPGVLTEDVADMGVLLLLAASRRLIVMDRCVRNGEWEGGQPLWLGSSVRDKVAGIFGFGRIGQALANRLKALGMRVRYFQPRPVEYANVVRDESLLELARQSDYLILCAPANENTYGTVNSDVLAALGPTGTLINIARGSLVDEVALIRALERHDLAAAALDVFAHEPEVPEVLRNLENVILSPHAASATVESREAMGQLTIDNLLAHFRGKQLLTPVI